MGVEGREEVSFDVGWEGRRETKMEVKEESLLEGWTEGWTAQKQVDTERYEGEEWSESQLRLKVEGWIKTRREEKSSRAHSSKAAKGAAQACCHATRRSKSSDMMTPT